MCIVHRVSRHPEYRTIHVVLTYDTNVIGRVPSTRELAEGRMTPPQPTSMSITANAPGYSFVKVLHRTEAAKLSGRNFTGKKVDEFHLSRQGTVSREKTSITEDNLEWRDSRNSTRRTCNKGDLKWVGHDSHGYHGRKPRYKEHRSSLT